MAPFMVVQRFDLSEGLHFEELMIKLDTEVTIQPRFGIFGSDMMG